MADTRAFHVRLSDEKSCAKIDGAMENFDPNTADYLEKPVNKGTLCAARFSDDENWYRAKLLGPVAG
jgi:hypothetical protein